jgi:hypothetical protein
MKKFNIKALAKGMSLKDKAKLILADHDQQCISQGKDRLLTSDEEAAIERDCRKRGEMGRMNEFYNYYNLKNRAMVMTHAYTVQLDLALTRIEMLSLGITDVFREERTLKSILSRVSKLKGEDARKLTKEIETEADAAMNKSVCFYPFSGDFDLECEDLEPNVAMQRFFTSALRVNKELRKAMYMVGYAERKAGMSFPCSIEEATFKSAKYELDKFENMEGFLGIMLGLYGMAVKDNWIRKDDWAEPLFLDLVMDPKKTLQLTDEDKQEMKADADRWLNDY